MATTITIAGSSVTLSESTAWPVAMRLSLDGCSTLTLQRRGGPLVGIPDPWLGKAIELRISGTLYFAGDVLDWYPSYTGLGWVVTYQCRDLRYRGDRIPYTDENTGTDSSAYNLPSNDRDYLSARSGRTVGQIITTALTDATNSAALNTKGIGGYTSMGPPAVLPSTTVADLAALTVIPPTAVYIAGEKLLSAIEAFLSAWAPNHAMWVQPDGTIRFLDMRTFTNHTFTLGVDPVEPTPLHRSVAECYQKVIVRGSPLVEPKLVTLLSGGLVENFGYGGLTNAQAKTAFLPTDFEQDAAARSQGTCTCTDTLNVVVDPTDATQAWASNYWDQTGTGHKGVLYGYHSAGSGINQYIARRIASNAALTAGGTGNCVLDSALPATNYDHFKIYGITTGAGLVYRNYTVADSATAAKMARQFSYDVPYIGASGNVAVMTSYPIGSVCYSSSGNPPFAEYPAAFTQDPSTGQILFLVPTWKTAGGHEPSDVRVMLAINTGALNAHKPTSGWEGTSNTVEGMQETLTVQVDAWRDPVNQTAMEAYAQDLLDSVKDTIVEGTIVYKGLYLAALTFGQAASVTGTGYTTGWESLTIPVREAELYWNDAGNAMMYTTVMHVSNRKAHYSSSAFLRPDREIGGATIGGGMSLTIFGGAAGSAILSPEASNAMSYQKAAQAREDQADFYSNLVPDSGDDGAVLSDGSDLATGGRNTYDRGRIKKDRQAQQQRAAIGRDQIENARRVPETDVNAGTGTEAYTASMTTADIDADQRENQRRYLARQEANRRQANEDRQNIANDQGNNAMRIAEKERRRNSSADDLAGND